MSDVLLIVLVVVSIAVLALLLVLLRKASQTDAGTLAPRLDAFEKAQERLERAVRDEVARSREELGKAAREQRMELTEQFKTFGDSVVQRMTAVATTQKDQLGSFAQASGERLDGVRSESAAGAKQLREEVVSTLTNISEAMTRTMTELATVQKNQLDTFSSQLGSFAKASGERLDAARAESATGAKQLREEVTKTMSELASSQTAQFDAFSGQIASLTRSTTEKLDASRTESAVGAKQLREEVIAALKGITETNTRTMAELANAQKSQLEVMAAAIGKLSESNEKKLEEVRLTVESKLQNMQIDNANRLEQMRQTVDEKLQGTLNERLGEAFKQVTERLEQVHKGLGEMQTLATGVGDLKKVLTNVKTRGTWGEVQLGALLEQVLSPDQFESNVATKDGRERVEFAIKLPGQGGHEDDIVWLPIDAKFPLEDYQRLVEAQERVDVDAVEAAGKQLENRVKMCARDISDKYLNPPNTTDFGILFMPIEGLFAEVIRRTGLTEVIQRESRVIIAGPTTLWSILNSLQMGFRTLTIQKRSSEVWNLLAAVKTEWTKYGEVLDSVQKKLNQATKTIEEAQRRSRAVGRKLKDVQALPANDEMTLLPHSAVDDDSETDRSDGVVEEI